MLHLAISLAINIKGGQNRALRLMVLLLHSCSIENGEA